MAAQQPARRSASPFDPINTWMAQRQADVLRLGHEAEAAGRQEWARATRAGQEVVAKTSGAVRELGARTLEAKQKLEKQGRDASRTIQKQVHAAAEPARRIAKQTEDKISAGVRDARDGAIRLISAADAAAHDVGEWLDHDTVAKGIAGDAVRYTSLPAGVALGAWHTTKDVAGAAYFATRLMDPLDAMFSPIEDAAWGQAIRGVKGIVGEAKEAISHPGRTVDGIVESAKRFKSELLPGATPQADTFAYEMQRQRELGLKQGERAFDVGSLFLGGAEAKMLTRLAEVGEKGAAKYIARGIEPRLAEYLAKPYNGMGSHFMARRSKLPSWLGGGPVPKGILDSTFFLNKGKCMTNGDFFEYHFRTDPRYYGGPVPAEYGGGGWSGDKLGWTKYGRAGRLYYGAPLPLKAAIGSAVAGAGATVDEIWPEDEHS